MKITTVPKEIKDSIARVDLWCKQKEDELARYLQAKYPLLYKNLSFKVKDNSNEGTFHLWLNTSKGYDSIIHSDIEVLLKWAERKLQEAEE